MITQSTKMSEKIYLSNLIYQETNDAFVFIWDDREFVRIFHNFQKLFDYA